MCTSSSRAMRISKDLEEYDNLSASAYLRAKEDYLMGINFSRLLTLKYGNTISKFMNTDRTVLSVGRVMTCVLGMVVRRGARNPRLCKDSILSCVEHNSSGRKVFRRRMEERKRFPLF